MSENEELKEIDTLSWLKENRLDTILWNKFKLERITINDMLEIINNENTFEEYCKEDLKLHRIEAACIESNIASQSVLIKNGYIPPEAYDIFL